MPLDTYKSYIITDSLYGKLFGNLKPVKKFELEICRFSSLIVDRCKGNTNYIPPVIILSFYDTTS